MTENLFTDRNKFTDVEYNYKIIREKIAIAAEKSGRKPEDITFLAAVKTVSPELINHAISLGLDHIGENRVQELLSKYESYDLSHCDLQFIGHLQTNKVRQIIDKVSMIQSVDSVHLAKEISRQAVLKDVHTNILVEVNVGNEESKSGAAPENVLELIDEIREFPGISVKGLMTIPPICDKKSEILKYFSKIRNLFIDISHKNIDNVNMVCLSMGMSDDYDAAIEEGATMVRIGSALFGKRIYK